jgi:hypothetical protein
VAKSPVLVETQDVGYTQNMSGYYSDTHPEMEALQIELLRQSPPWRYPGIGPQELHRRLADLLLGDDLAQKVYGDPDYDR